MKIKGQEYEINRDNAVVSKWDNIYCDLLKRILIYGEYVENRTGIPTYSVDTVLFTIDLEKDGYPLLESKKVNIKNAISELLWIYQAQSNDVSWLHDRGNKIWDEWEIDQDGIYRIYEASGEYDPDKQVPVMDLDGNVMHDEDGNVIYTGGVNKPSTCNKTIKSAKYFGKEYAGTIGTAYGWINNKFKRPQYVLDKLKNDPRDRRMVISMWQDEYLKTAVLPSCVWSSTWKVSNGRLNAIVNQRSCDVPLGLPFNVSQYACLLEMFAKVSGYKPGKLTFSIMDAHVYDNQVDKVKLQLERFDRMKTWERKISSMTDKQLEEQYNAMLRLKEKLSKINADDEKIVEWKRDIDEEIMIFELMVTNEKPILKLANYDNFFDYSNEVNNDSEYLKENMTGNKDIKVLKYKSAPFLKMPVAQ